MSEGGDYEPVSWGGGHDFSSARDDYSSRAKTSFVDAVDRGVKASDLLPKTLKTNCRNPLLINVDQTGSVGEKFLKVLFSKLPYILHEAKTEYMGKDVEVSWGATGDAYNPNREKYPLQALDFATGEDSLKKMNSLVLEGDGGGSSQETYELTALYYARNVEMPKAIRPLLIFIGDESPYAKVRKEQARVIAYCDIDDDLSTGDVFEELKREFSVYFVQKPYGNETLSQGGLTGTTLRVHTDWASLVGEDHIALLDDPDRVADVIFGIMAQEAGKVQYFKKEIEDRQKPDQVQSAYRALRTIHTPSDPKARKLESRSVTRHRKVGD